MQNKISKCSNQITYMCITSAFTAKVLFKRNKFINIVNVIKPINV